MIESVIKGYLSPGESLEVLKDERVVVMNVGVAKAK
jgi:hypothetical protein